jgi:lysophospholipase L1-like esterase
VAVWLGEKAFDKHKEYLPRINMSLKFEKTSLAAFDGEKSGPNNWAVNADDKEKGVLTTDRVHLNEAGNKLVAETILATIDK